MCNVHISVCMCMCMFMCAYVVCVNTLKQEKENMDPKVSEYVCVYGRGSFKCSCVMFSSSCLIASITHFVQGCAYKSCPRMYKTNAGDCMGI